jgi:hypothetical protein
MQGRDRCASGTGAWRERIVPQAGDALSAAPADAGRNAPPEERSTGRMLAATGN